MHTRPTVTVPLATFTLFPGRTGRLRAIHGLDAVADLPEVVRVVPAVAPGELISADFEIWAVNLLLAGFLDHPELHDLYAEAAALVTFDADDIDDEVDHGVVAAFGRSGAATTP